jgi:hypothetical protein
MINPNYRFYKLFCKKEQALDLLQRFPYMEEFIQVWIQRNYPVSKCTREQVACLPIFNAKQIEFLDNCYRPFETDPVRDHFASWYEKKQEE